MSFLAEEVKARLVAAQDRARHIDEVAGRCLAALEESKGLAADIYGVPCAEYVRQNSAHIAREASLVKASLDHLVRRLHAVTEQS